jgi:hypothetical protein
MKVNGKFSKSRSRAHIFEAALQKAHMAALVERAIANRIAVRGHLWSHIPRAAAAVKLPCALGQGHMPLKHARAVYSRKVMGSGFCRTLRCLS